MSIQDYEASESSYTDITVYLAKKDISVGEEITEDKLSACTMKVPQANELHYILDKQKILHSYAKTTLKKGSILTLDMLLSNKDFQDKTRLVELTDVKLPTEFSTSDLLEVRISFPNGEDFVVLKQQQVQCLLSEEDFVFGISLSLSEEELLRLSSARVDCMLYEDAYLYAVSYQAGYDHTAAVNYPVNADVFSLMQWDPNIPNFSPQLEEQEKRNQLETRLLQFLQHTSADLNFAIEVDENYNISQE